jgi:hypothetical protein
MQHPVHGGGYLVEIEVFDCVRGFVVWVTKKTYYTGIVCKMIALFYSFVLGNED